MPGRSQSRRSLLEKCYKIPAMTRIVKTKKISARPAEQPFKYPLKRSFEERDWRRFPGWRGVTRQEWESAVWQRRNSVKSVQELKSVLGGLLPDDLAEDILKDQRDTATMVILIPPHMLNTMD
jgi:lysine 2,3-aminomutase